MEAATEIVPFEAESEYRAAVTALTEAAEQYYSGSGLTMADADYDALLARVQATETDHPDWTVPHDLNKVAAGVGAGDVPHTVPMLSLDKAHTADGLKAWWDRLTQATSRDVPVVVEPKLDGIAIAARYVNGKLAQVLTRGDGQVGEDVTTRVPAGTVGLPRTVTETGSFEVRGELVFTADQFEVANTHREAEGKPRFVNARNALAGSIRREDLPADKRPPMTLYLYTVIGDRFDNMDHDAAMREMADLGFTPALSLVTGKTVTNVEEVIEQVNMIGEARTTFACDIDGAVIKANCAGDRDLAGQTSSHPRWAIAFKYAPQEVTTVLEDIEVAVGRTGIHSLRGRVRPVMVGGATVTYATLHNPSDLQARDVRPGDTVIVRRAGDVIPEITGHTHRPEGSEPWEMPTSCIKCNEPLDTSEKRWRCVNRACTAGAGALLVYAVSRDALDIDGLGETGVVTLMEAGLVNDLADLHDLTVDQVAALEGFGEVSAAKLIAGIAASKSQPLHRLVTALGIRMTGRRMSRRLAAHFRTLEAFRAASVDDLQKVEGVGARRAEVIRSELDQLGPLLDRLVAAGVRTTEDTVAPVSGSLSGKKVVVTGTMTGPYSGFSRTQMSELLESHGAKVSSSVSKSTDMLVAGDAAGSKLTKANDLGVKVLTPEDLHALLN